ncbi:MAG: hypothetical protein JW987_12540 [Anaerolineaceae bacterium]|nr:hypothetical protein [Anaerolineaceae bacterium]
MSATQVRLFSSGLLVVLIFVSGFWVSRAGKPYPALNFNVHKLIALAAVVLLGIVISKVNKAAPLNSNQWLGVVVAVVCAMVTILTGGLASIDRPLPAILSTLHKVFPYLSVLSTGWAMYLLLK